MLADLLSGGPLPVADAVRFSVGLAEALRRIHEKGNVYGILHPSRVSVRGNGVELLPAGDRTELSPYSAPEQLQGKQGDPRSDVFALGAVLYEMLAGRKAFPSGSREGPPPLQDLPPALTSLLRKCLEIRPERRLQRVQLALIQLKLLEAVNGWGDRTPVLEPMLEPMPERIPERMPEPEPRPKAIPSRQPIHPFLKIVTPPPPSRGVCPTCKATNLRQSRPRGTMEKSLQQVGARFNRCYSCYNRFMKLAFLTFKRPG